MQGHPDGAVSAGGAAPSRDRQKLVIFDFSLVGFRGHFFNYVTGFREAGDALGMAVSVYVPAIAAPEVVALLGAQPRLPDPRLTFPDRANLMDSLAHAAALMRSAWHDVDQMALTGNDILLFAEASLPAMFDLVRWLAATEEASRPAVFIRFIGSEIKDGYAASFNADAEIHQLVGALLAAVPGSERVFYTINVAASVGALVRVAGRRVFPVPMPKYYGQYNPPQLARATSGARSVYFHVTLAEHESMVRGVAEILLSRHPAVSVVIKHCWRRGGNISRSGGIAVIGGSQSPEAYLATIEEADIVVLPYQAETYQTRSSGVFCEAAAFGKVCVTPAPTWMSGEIENGRAAGTLFAMLTAEALLTAVEEAYGAFEDLSAAARDRASAFRAENSCDRNLALMLELAAGIHDMRINCVPGASIGLTETVAARQYLVRGWSYVERGLGVWTDGPEAELCLRVGRDAQPRSLVITLVPFLAARHTRLDVAVSVNGAAVAEWVFSGDGWKSEERTIAIPDGFTGPELRVAFRIHNPASPHALGMSPDERQLGILLQKVVVAQEAPGERAHTGAPDPAESRPV